MEILHGQQLGLAVFQPFRAFRVLALGAVPVAAGVIRDAGVATLAAFLDVRPQGSGGAARGGGLWCGKMPASSEAGRGPAYGRRFGRMATVLRSSRSSGLRAAA